MVFDFSFISYAVNKLVPTSDVYGAGDDFLSSDLICIDTNDPLHKGRQNWFGVH